MRRGADRPGLTAAVAALALAGAALGGCRATGDDGPAGSGAATTVDGEAPAASFAARLCEGEDPAELGTVTAPELDEVSGIVASRRQPGVLWAIADSGFEPLLVAIGLDGEVRASIPVEGARNEDWEDIALLRGEGGEPDRLVIADTGDNEHERSTVALVVVPEPDLAAGDDAVEAERWLLRWPDGPTDAEALLADPRTGELYLFTKHLFGGSNVARVPADAGPGRTVALERVTLVRTGIGEAVTAASASPDGSAIVLRTYLSVLVFERPEGASVVEALEARPCRAPSPDERQGESLTVLPDASGFVTASEGGDQPLWLVAARPG